MTLQVFCMATKAKRSALIWAIFALSSAAPQAVNASGYQVLNTPPSEYMNVFLNFDININQADSWKSLSSDGSIFDLTSNDVDLNYKLSYKLPILEYLNFDNRFRVSPSGAKIYNSTAYATDTHMFYRHYADPLFTGAPGTNPIDNSEFDASNEAQRSVQDFQFQNISRQLVERNFSSTSLEGVNLYSSRSWVIFNPDTLAVRNYLSQIYILGQLEADFSASDIYLHMENGNYMLDFIKQYRNSGRKFDIQYVTGFRDDNVPYSETSYWYGSARLSSITITQISNVPEPSEWIFYLLGFGVLGSFLRTRSSVDARRLDYN